MLTFGDDLKRAKWSRQPDFQFPRKALEGEEKNAD